MSPNADAIESLEQSIQITLRRCEEQQKLKGLLIEYNDLKKRFLQETLSKAEVWHMVNLSEQARQLIEREHLEPMFSMEFIEELQVFSAFANKTSISIKGATP
ncbi:MAG: hypothetical protein KGZ30_00100 [Anaplasmataceae bacterium]|nr:hypothetical protein [Anaplasmataceae bacterium]